ncbi:MAG: amino acid adenylation domain-containing protein, partial [bacterium]|nr:amino acid adenylation domain-containing protein [bacterium]
VKTKFNEFIKWIQNRDLNKEEIFWGEYLKGIGAQPELSVKRKGKRTGSVENHQITFSAEMKAGLENFGKKYKVTLSSLLYAAWGLLLQKYNDCGDVIFGATVSGRNSQLKGIEDMVGLFINTLPLRVRLETFSNETILEFLCMINKGLPAWEAYETSSLVNLKEYTRLNTKEELFDSVFVIENYPLDIRNLRGGGTLAVGSYSMVERTHYDLTVAVKTSDAIEINFMCLKNAFDKDIIGQIARHFTRIIQDILENPEKEAHQVEILPELEKKQVLYDFNNIRADYVTDKAIRQLFGEQVMQTPDSIAVTGTAKSAAHYPVQCTYKKLNEKSGRLARLLRAKGIKPGDIVAIMVERSIEMIEGITAVLETGGTYLPVNPENPGMRTEYMLNDVGAGLLLTTHNLIRQNTFGVEIVYLEESHEAAGQCIDLPLNPQPAHDFSDFAYIIYTSGSTGNPKGIPITHSNLCPLLHWGYRQFHLDSKERVVQNLAYYFDWSVWEIFITLTSGAGLHMISDEVLLNPKALVEFIDTNSITVLHITPTQWQYLVNVGLRLETLKFLFIGAEKLTCDLVQQSFQQLNEACRVYNMYGPTEVTIISAVLEIDRKEPGQYKNLSSVPIGKPIANGALYILNKHLKPCPVNIAGELYLAGDGVAAGYLNNPGLTGDKFIHGAVPFISHAAPLYRTGDLSRWLPDGNVEFLGRIDHQVKIRGFRIEPGEIEKRLLTHNNVKEAIVVAGGEEAGDKYLCAYIVADSVNSVKAAELRDYLSLELPGYMVPAYFGMLETMPLNANGKLDRKALPEPEGISGRQYHPPRNEREEQLVEIWSGVLGISKERIGIDDNFFELGGHSLKVARLLGRINRTFNIEIPFSMMFEKPTIRAINICMSELKERVHRSVPPAEEKEYYPLTPSQKRFYVFQQMNPGDCSYNMNETMSIEGPLCRERFEAAFRQLLERHESLRTSFHMVDGQPVQRFHREVEFEISDMGGGECDFIRPFDLSRAPLLRVGLLRTAPGNQFLTIDMHHLVADGTSVGIFIRDFLLLYKREVDSLPPLKLQFRDFVVWREKERSGAASGPRDVSVPGELPGELPDELLNLPTDYTRPAQQSFEGNYVRFVMDNNRSEAFYQLCTHLDVTPYMLLLAVFNVLLAKLSGQDNIAVGSPIAGRSHVDIEYVMGLFLHTICLRNRPSGEKCFSHFLGEVKERALFAYDNQDYQYDELVEQMTQAREGGRNPLFDVMLVLQNMEMPEIEIPGLTVTRNVGERLTSKFDMTLYCEEEDVLVFYLEYSTALFKRETIERYITYFKTVLSVILEFPHKKIFDIEIISGEEKRRILFDFNDTAVEYPRDKTVFQLFEEQVKWTPEHIAVIGSVQGAENSGGVTVTYRELNEKANCLARILRKRGIKPNTAAGILMERSVDVMTAILAVQKSGGAYLPIDPEYPDKRTISMMEESGAPILLTTRRIVDKKDIQALSHHREILVTDEEPLARQLQQEYSEDPEPLSGPENLIYIIFTSGSTGKPTGAGVYHRGFINLMHWFVTEFKLNSNDRNLLLTSLSFDLTQKNLYTSLITGGTLCIPEFNYFEPRSLLREIHHNRITWINCTPSMFCKLVEYEEAGDKKRLFSLRYAFLGGEPISMPALINWLESEDCRAEIVNTYGPTECTDICNFYRVKEPRKFLDETIPVGKAVYNVQLYIPDKNLHPLPVGVAGELLIGGEGVGIGYVNDKELTARKFLTHSFLPGEPGMLLYRTGDLVKWLPDGNIEFLGRIDHQVKIRGYRIEVGEIEGRLLSHPGVKEALVLAREGDAGDKYLCAYIVAGGMEHG